MPHDKRWETDQTDEDLRIGGRGERDHQTHTIAASLTPVRKPVGKSAHKTEPETTDRNKSNRTISNKIKNGARKRIERSTVIRNIDFHTNP